MSYVASIHPINEFQVEMTTCDGLVVHKASSSSIDTETSRDQLSTEKENDLISTKLPGLNMIRTSSNPKRFLSFVKESSLNSGALDQPVTKRPWKFIKRSQLKQSSKSTSPRPADKKEQQLKAKAHEKTAVEPAMIGKPWCLTLTNKYTGRVSKQVTPLHLERLQISRIMDEFEQGLLEEQTFASLLITVLFNRDFKMKGNRWNVYSAHVSKEAEGGSVKFTAEKEANLNWNEYFCVALAKGTIYFFPERQEIRVEEYDFSVAGYRFNFLKEQ